MNVKAGTLSTRWALRTYDVWGNAEDGYDVNDSYDGGEVELRIPQTVYNVGTDQVFLGASPTDRQIMRTFGVRCAINTDGDDMVIYVNRARDSYPLGEMHCESHKSLSPVRNGEENE